MSQDPQDPREVYLTSPERAELLRALDDLAAAEKALDRHRRTMITSADVNPAGDMGGIRSWSQKKKDRMWNRVYRDARQATLLGNALRSAQARPDYILSGQWMRNQILERQAAQERAERRRRSVEAEQRRALRRQERAERQRASRRAQAADLAAYNMLAEYVYQFCERVHHGHAGHAKKWPEMSLTDHYHWGARAPWIEVQATIVAAHLRGPGERATAAMVLRELDRSRARAIAYQAQHPKDPRIAARTWGHLAADTKIRALFGSGALALADC